MQGEVDGVADELRNVAHGGVDISRRDEHAARGLVGGKTGGVHDSGHADGDDGRAQRALAELGAVVADAGAGDDTGVRELHRAAEPLEAIRGQGVNGQDPCRRHGRRDGAQQLRGLQPRRAQHAGPHGADLGEGGEVLRQLPFQVAGGEDAVKRQRPHGVRRHRGVAKAGDEGTAAGRGEQGAHFPCEQLRGLGEGGLAPPQERVQLDGDIAANGLT